MTIDAELFEITGRRRFDPMSVSTCGDFRLKRVRAVQVHEAPSTEHWVPYCLDRKTNRAALVQAPPDIDLGAAPFYYQAQYEHARQLLLVGYDGFIALAHHRQRPFTPLLIHSTGRAGTTLLSKMLARAQSCISLSEPDFYTSVLDSGLPSSESIPLLTAATQLYFQPRPDQPATHLALKFRGMCVELAADLRAALPNARDLFLYRDAEAYIASSMGAFGYFPSPLWGIRWLHRLVVTQPILTAAFAFNYASICRMFPLAADFTPRELTRLGPIGLVALSWLSMMDRAWKLSQTDRPLPSLRYEDFLHDPRAALERIFALAGLPDNELEPALTALNSDSQAGSVVARGRKRAYQLSAKDREIIRAVLARHPVINRPDYTLPAAILPP